MEKIAIEAKTKLETVNLVLDTLKINKQAIVFVNSKPSAEKQADDIAKYLEIKVECEELSKEILKALPSPTKQCERLAEAVKYGVAFHHAGLNQKQKDLIEDAFKEGKIRIICATPTLAAGVDMPAYRTILKDLKRYGARGMEFIPVLEYLQMAGRAGRPRYDNEGQAICIAKTEKEKDDLYFRYVIGEPENIYSKLAVEPVLRTYLLSLISSNFVNSEKSIFSFFDKTFYAHQFGDTEQLHKKILKMLQTLANWEFIKTDEFVSAKEIDGKKYSATLLGKRVAELYIDPLTAHYFLINVRKAAELELRDISILQLICNTLEMRPMLSVKSKDQEEIDDFLNENEKYLLESSPMVYDLTYEDFLGSIKTTLFLEAWINEKSEEDLFEKYGIRPGEIKYKLDISNWLMYTLEEIARIDGKLELITELKKLKMRIKYGAKEELLKLLRLKGVGKVKARKLYNNNIKNLKDLRTVDLVTLKQLVGEALANKIKLQLGEELLRKDS